MSVILEFVVDVNEFALGDILEKSTGMQFELERIVPLRTDTSPIVWASGGDFEAFEDAVRDDPRVESLIALDRFDDRGLYRIEWANDPTGLIEAIEEAGASVLETRGDGDWLFRLRFDDHDELSRFHDGCVDRDLSIRIERTYSLSEETDLAGDLGLSSEQREALLLAFDRGYFASPSEVSLDELAAELGISRQALSDRIRRGNETVLRETLRPSVSDAGTDR